MEVVLSELLTEAASLQDIHTKYYSDIPDRDFDTVVQSDPTWRSDKPDKMGRFGKWLLNLYKKRLVKMEDLYKVKEDLGLFVKYYNRISDKDINHYQTPDALSDAVSQYRAAEDSGQEMATSNSDEVRKAKADARKVYEDSQWLILTPLTQEAAVYYGKNTKWCTAASQGNNMFAKYNSQGPLYICIDKTRNVKYQFHFESAQYMDAMDKQIAEPVIQTIGMSDKVAQSAFGGDSLLIRDDGHGGYEKLCGGCYCNQKAVFKFDGNGEPQVVYNGGGWAVEAKWLGGRLVYANSRNGTVVINADTGQVLDKGSVSSVLAYGNNTDNRVFACHVKGRLSVCRVTSENRIKIINDFRTTATPDTLDEREDSETDFPRYFKYNSGGLDARTRKSTFNVYDMSQCKVVLEDVIYTRDDDYDHWMCDDGRYYLGLRTAIDPDSYYDDDDQPMARYYRIYEDQNLVEDGDDNTVAESRRVDEYLDKETGTPLLRAARQNGLEDVEVVKNRWAIHFASEGVAPEIVRTGFRHGLSGKDLNRHTMVISSDGEHVEDGGYFYAYDVDDLMDANFSLLNAITTGYAVMFRVNGIKYHNSFDEDEQVMFADSGVRDKILLYRWGGYVAKGGRKGDTVSNDDELWGVGCVNGSPVFYSTLGNVIKWVVANFDQYKRQLVGNTEVPEYNEWHEKSEEEYFSRNDLLAMNAANKYQRWHNQQERHEDERHAEERFSEAEYGKFCKERGVDLATVRKEAEEQVRQMTGLPQSAYDDMVNSVVGFRLAHHKASWSDFVEHQEAEHPFYIRTRPDGDYWKWH